MTNVYYLLVCIAVIGISIFMVTPGDSKTTLKNTLFKVVELAGGFLALGLVVYYLSLK